jgi:hypothetical protein
VTFSPELEREVERVMPSRTRRSLASAGAFGLALLVGGTAAVAAVTGVIPVGSPAKDAGGEVKPDEGLGVLAPGSARVLAVQANDPDGGLPWGLRLTRTTRNLGCLQAGRLQDGRIGVLGRDGAFNDDGRFHPIADDSVGHAGTCLQPDAKGQFIGSAVYGGIPASASTEGDCYAPQFTRGVPKDQLCDAQSIRILYYGLLGPQASSIVVAGTREIPTVGDEGAYLIVDRIGDSGMGGVMTGPVMTNTPITEIRFKDGSRCSVDQSGPDKGCVNPGAAAPADPGVTAAEVKAPIRVKTWRTGKRWHARISFRAPVAIPDASAAYAIRLSVPSKKQRGRGIGTATARNFKAGETVVFQFDYLGGHGRYHGEVTYQRSRGVIAVPQRDGLRVARVSFRLP